MANRVLASCFFVDTNAVLDTIGWKDHLKAGAAMRGGSAPRRWHNRQAVFVGQRCGGPNDLIGHNNASKIHSMYGIVYYSCH